MNIALHSCCLSTCECHINIIYHINAILKNSLRLNTLQILSENHTCKIHQIYSDIQQCSTGKFRIPDPFYLTEFISQICCQRSNFSNHTILNKFIYHISGRHISCPDCLCKKKLLFLCKPQYFLCLLRIYSKCLFTKYMLSCLQAHLCTFIMMRMRCCYIDKLYFRIFQHLLIRTIKFRKSILLCKLLCPVFISCCNGIRFYIVHFCNCSSHFICNGTSSHNRHF